MARIPELRDQLLRATERLYGVDAGHRRRRRRGVVLVALGIVASAGAVATAAVVIDRPAPDPRQESAMSPQEGSLRTLVKAQDPSLPGTDWVLQTFRTGGGDRCGRAGQVVDGRFGIRFPTGAFLPLLLGDLTGAQCRPNGVATLQLTDDPRSEAPTLWRTLAFGLLETVHADAKSVEVRTATETVTAPVNDGGWLAVLPGHVQTATLQVRVVEPDGTRATLAVRAPRRARRAATVARIAQTAPDPRGGVGFGLLRYPVRDHTCVDYGRAVDGQVGALPLPGVFISSTDFAATEHCVRTGSRRLKVWGATQPLDGAPTGNLVVYGHAPTRQQLSVAWAANEHRLGTAEGWFLGVVETPLVEPYARTLAQRLGAPVVLRARKDDGRAQRLRVDVGR